MDKVRKLSNEVMAKGPGKRPRIVFNILKSKLNVQKDDIVNQDDGLYKCTSIMTTGCAKVCKVTLISWDPKEGKGKILVNKKYI